MIQLSRRDWWTIATSFVVTTALLLLPAGRGDCKPMPSGWSAFRSENIASECAACGRTTNLELHHIVPRSVAPDRTLDSENVLTLCDWCHVVIGHLGNERTRWNVGVKADSAKLRECISRFYESRKVVK